MTILLSVAVMAHPARRDRAEQLARSIGASIVWDRYSDEWDTGSRTLASFDRSATHHLVLQDDAVPVAGFHRHAVRALEQHPDSPVSFYLGRGRPPQWQRRIIQATLLADELGAAWISCPEMLHGVAIALPTTDIAPLLRWARDRREPYDERIGKWYREQDRRVMYTWPSLVDHEDSPPVVTYRADGAPRTEARIARRHGTPDRWDTDTVEVSSGREA